MHRRGTSLAEALVSLGVLIPLISVAVGIVPYGHVATRRASYGAAAYDVACAAMESARATPFDSLPASATQHYTIGNVNYTALVTATPVDPTEKPIMLKRVTAVVTFQTHTAQRLQLTSMLARVNP
jgi:hypothetical protein